MEYIWLDCWIAWVGLPGLPGLDCLALLGLLDHPGSSFSINIVVVSFPCVHCS
jgi:hypothetical protein